MKKLLVIIIILLVIFISLLIYRTSEKSKEIKIEEINQIETYLKKIYGWKEVTNEALPIFDDINSADEKWIWGTVRENIDDYEIDYEKIEKIAKELYGEKFNKQYPKEGTEFITYDSQNEKYQVKEITLDAIKDSFIINKIDKEKEEFSVEIIEYLVDYTNIDNGKIEIKNLNNEKIYELSEEEATEGNIQKVVKENMNKFSKKQVNLQKSNDFIYIVSVKI